MSEEASSRVDVLVHVDRIFLERQRAMDLAEREREKAAAALRSEEHRASDKAERERESAANVLAEGLRHAISEGDERLREHVVQQIAQIASALISANQLELERFESVKAEVESLRREMILVAEAQQVAVAKAEEAQKETNERSNDYRGQLRDQHSSMMPRLEAEARMSQLSLQVAANTEKIGKLL